MKGMIIISMHGIGDNIYQRPLIKKLVKEREVYIATPLPELYTDIENLKIIKVDTIYRTQIKHINNTKSSKIETVQWPKNKDEYDIVNPLYAGDDLSKYSVVYSMARKFNVNDFELNSLEWDLPKFNLSLNGIDGITQKIAVIRPNTIRTEWQVTTRPCDPKYICWAAKILKEAGYFIVSIADTEEGKEWIDGEEPFAHIKLHKGELGIPGTLELIKRAHITVGSSGFIVPAAISAGSNLFTIFGGRGKFDSPYKIFHPSMNLKKIGWVLPDNFCQCGLNDHTCDKTISNFESQFLNFLKQIS